MKVVAITPRQKTDALASLIIEGLYENDIEIIASDTGNGISKSYSDEDIIEHAKDADYILAFFGKSGDKRWPRNADQLPPKYYLLDRINLKEKTAYIDGSEWTSTGHPDNYEQVSGESLGYNKLHRHAVEAKYNSSRYRGRPWINEDLLLKSSWYFKRECHPEDSERGIIPLPFGIHNSYFNPPGDIKDIDIFCSFGQLYTGLRFEVDDYCKNFASQKYKVCTNTSLGRDAYRDSLSRAIIGVSAWGGGNCCMREWEIIASRACCFIQRPMIDMPNRPKDGVHWVEYSSIDEFSEKLDFYMNHLEECVKIANNGYAFAEQYHTSKARVRYMLDVMIGDRG